ncbi:MAG: hypothetical protein ACRDUW_17305, partial [Pseudonocardiaceae bacterium]
SPTILHVAGVSWTQEHGFVEIAHAGVFDDVPQAATAWRALVGDMADSAQPERVETAERERCSSLSVSLRVSPLLRAAMPGWQLLPQSCHPWHLCRASTHLIHGTFVTHVVAGNEISTRWWCGRWP